MFDHLDNGQLFDLHTLLTEVFRSLCTAEGTMRCAGASYVEHVSVAASEAFSASASIWAELEWRRTQPASE